MDPVVVFDALAQVAGQAGIEEADRHLHQLDQKVRNQADGDPGAHMEQDPAPDKSQGGLAHHQNQLGDQDQEDKTGVARADTHVDDGLGQKRKKQADQAGGQKTGHQLKQQPAVWAEVFPEEPESPGAVRRHLLPEEAWGGLQEKGHPGRFLTCAGGSPVVQKFFPCDLPEPVSRISHTVGHPLPSAPDPVEDHIVVLVPVQDRRQQGLPEAFDRQAHPPAPESHRLGRVGKRKQRNPLTRLIGKLPQPLQPGVTPVIPGHHLEADRPAIHGIGLYDVRKTQHIQFSGRKV